MAQSQGSQSYGKKIGYENVAPPRTWGQPLLDGESVFVEDVPGRPKKSLAYAGNVGQTVNITDRQSPGTKPKRNVGKSG